MKAESVPELDEGMETNDGKVIVIYRIDYIQLSTENKMKHYKIMTIFVSPEEPKARANKTDINFMIYFNIHGKLTVIRCYT